MIPLAVSSLPCMHDRLYLCLHGYRLDHSKFPFSERDFSGQLLNELFMSFVALFTFAYQLRVSDQTMQYFVHSGFKSNLLCIISNQSLYEWELSLYVVLYV